MSNLSQSIERRPAPLKADQVIAPGDLLMTEAATGLAVKYTTAAGHRFLGYATHSRDSTGLANGELTVLYSHGMTELTPDSGVTPLHGHAAYGVNATTFTLTPTTGRYIGLVVQKYTGAGGSTQWTVDVHPTVPPETTA